MGLDTLSPARQGPAGWNLTAPNGAARPLAYNTPGNLKVIVLMADGAIDVSDAEIFCIAMNSGGNSPKNKFDQNNPDAEYSKIALECISSNNGGVTTSKAAGWANTDGDTWYSPYGRASTGTLLPTPPPFTNSPADDSGAATVAFSSKLDSIVASLCTAMRADGIIVYTILLHGSTDTQLDSYLGAGTGSTSAKALLQNCATDNAHYFGATSTTAITNAFVQIARQIISLRLVRCGISQTPASPAGRGAPQPSAEPQLDRHDQWRLREGGQEATPACAHSRDGFLPSPLVKPVAPDRATRCHRHRNNDARE